MHDISMVKYILKWTLIALLALPNAFLSGHTLCSWFPLFENSHNESMVNGLRDCKCQTARNKHFGEKEHTLHLSDIYGSVMVWQNAIACCIEHTNFGTYRTTRSEGKKALESHPLCSVSVRTHKPVELHSIHSQKGIHYKLSLFSKSPLFSLSPHTHTLFLHTAHFSSQFGGHFFSGQILFAGCINFFSLHYCC